MKSEWNIVKLGEVVNFNTGRLDSNQSEDNGKYPFFTCSPITLAINTAAFDTEAVLLAGNNANGVFSVKYYKGKFNAYQRTYVITPKDREKISTKWLYFRISHVTKELQQLSVGSATKFLTKKILDDFEIKLPNIYIQNKIEKILWSLENKIELNRKMNQTLEEMAQALFKSWFVDFDPVHAKAKCSSDEELKTAACELGISKEILELFPSEFEESELGMIPKGSEVKKIGNIGNIITGKTPPTKNLDNYGSDYPFITIPDMHNQAYIINTARYLSETGHLVQAKKLIPKNSLVVSCIATVGLVSITSEDSHTNQQINNIICEKRYLYYLYSLLSSMTDKLQMYGSAGTTTLNINKSTFENIEVLLANDNELDAFLNIVSPFFEKILANTKEIESLQKTRDTLLPKLLSGELDVSALDLGIE